MIGIINYRFFSELLKQLCSPVKRPRLKTIFVSSVVAAFCLVIMAPAVFDQKTGQNTGKDDPKYYDRLLDSIFADVNRVVELGMDYALTFKDVTFSTTGSVTFRFSGSPLSTIGSVIIPSSAARKLGLQVPPEKGAPRVDKIRSLLLSDYEMNDVPVFLYAKDTIVDKSLSEYGAVVGSVFLQNFTVTFDFSKKIVTLQHI